MGSAAGGSAITLNNISVVFLLAIEKFKVPSTIITNAHTFVDVRLRCEVSYFRRWYSELEIRRVWDKTILGGCEQIGWREWVDIGGVGSDCK